MGFPGGSVVKKLPANAGDAGSIPGSGRSPGGGNSKWQSTPIFLPGKSYGQRSLVGYSPQDCNLDVTERLSMILYYTLLYYALFFLNFFTFINGCDYEGFKKCHKTLFAIELSTSK